MRLQTAQDPKPSQINAVPRIQHRLVKRLAQRVVTENVHAEIVEMPPQIPLGIPDVVPNLTLTLSVRVIEFGLGSEDCQRKRDYQKFLRRG